MSEVYLKPKQVADMLNISAATVRRLCESDRIPNIQVGTGERKHFRIPESQIKPSDDGDDISCPLLEALQGFE